jgi:sec-independent protein translocase protein TatB
MFGFSIWHMTVIAVIALVFIGPKEMPKVMRVLARAVGQIRRLSAEFHGHFNELIREAEQAEERTVAQSKGPTQQVE